MSLFGAPRTMRKGRPPAGPLLLALLLGVAPVRADEALVTAQGANALAVVDLEAGSVVAQVAIDGAPAGCLYAYALPDRPADPEPAPDPDLPALFVPLQALEDMVPGTGHIHAIATAPDHRAHGVGAALMAHAERWRGPNGMSLIVADDNAAAIRLLTRWRMSPAMAASESAIDWPWQVRQRNVSINARALRSCAGSLSWRLA